MATQHEELKDFRNFLYLIWEFLGLPEPTVNQYAAAIEIQDGPRRMILEAFRGFGKSFITAAFVLYCLYHYPQMKIMVVSASGKRADNFSTFCLDLIRTMPLLANLKPGPNQRQSQIKFDVGPATADQSPSVKSVGITGQITGDRADLIIADDVEVPKNSMTESQREKLSELVKEFDSVLKPGGRVLYLGTPQCEASLYNKLQTRGYEATLLPAEYPKNTKQDAFYGVRLMTHVTQAMLTDPDLRGEPIEPSRFPRLELAGREFSYGRSGYALQFLLDTRLSDLNRYPLKLGDGITMSCNEAVAPENLVWASSPDLCPQDIECVGMDGDHYYRPMQVQGEWMAYTGSVLAIDPSGRGKDETTWCVIKFYNGFLYLLHMDGSTLGYTPETLTEITRVAKQFKVQTVIAESNYGDGMFASLLRPYLDREYPCTVEDRPVGNMQKELRVIDILEPVLNQHRLVFDEKVIKADLQVPDRYDGDSAHQYQLMYQITRLTKDRGSLAHDDRVDVLSFAVNFFTEAMRRDAERSMEKRSSEKREQQLRDFIKGVGGTVRKVVPKWGTSKRAKRSGRGR
jgi:hypothetical protein